MELKEQAKTRLEELEAEIVEKTKEAKALRKYLEAMGEAPKPKRARRKKGE